jgi:hypothetical protein
MRPVFDREAFGRDVEHWLAMRGLTYRSAAHSFYGLNTAMLSRAINRKKLEAQSLLAVCAAAGLDPFDYINVPRNQCVTANDKRETIVVSRHAR